MLQNRPRVARMFEVVRLAPLADEDALEVARGWARDHGVEVDEETLAEALDLATHYLPGGRAGERPSRARPRSRPGHARGRDGGDDRDGDRDAERRDGPAAPRARSTRPLSLDDVRAFFEARVLGQPEAVECLVDRVALVKAGLTDPTRPLGVFLFVGPTGTGKTEIAKAFSEFLFGSEERLIRLDMSEYQTPESLDRLLGDSTTRRQAAPLIAQVRKQPFSVLLLDEFEKAHPQVWDVFLQVFDDGRLTDRRGRTVDLRHCVIILTSNLGSAIPARPRRRVRRQVGRVRRRRRCSSPSSRSFRPEFLNRLDRVVVFRPLGRDIMRGLLEKELNDVLERRGFRMQPWAVEWDEAAVDYLIEQGFSAELGARPLKRAVERYLLTKIATAIVERQFPEGDQFLFITARDGAGLDVRSSTRTRAMRRRPSVPRRTGAELTLEPSRSTPRARRPRPPSSAPSSPTSSSAYARGTREARRPRGGARARVLGVGRAARRPGPGRVSRPARCRDGDRRAARRAPLLRTRGALERARALLAARLHVLAAALAGLDAREASDATVTVRAGNADEAAACEGFVQELAAMYVGWADGRGMRARRDGADGVVVLEVSGLGAYTLLKAESGLHVLELPGHERASAPSTASPPSWTSGRPAADRNPARRTAASPDRPPLPARAVAARPRHLGDPHGPDRPGARR